MRTGARNVAVVVHGTGVSSRVAAETRGEEVTWGAAKVLVVSNGRSKSVGRIVMSWSRSVSEPRSRSARHRALAHAVLRRIVHGRGIARVSNDGGTSSAGSAAKTAHILGKVVVAAHLVAAFPIASPERHHATSAHATTAMSHGSVMSTMRRRGHDGRGAVTTSVATVASRDVVTRAGAGGGEGASETSSSALEVREAARRACPIARSGPVLAWGEGSKNVLSTIQNATGRGRNFNGLFI